jgi:beta-glucosidase
MVTRKKSLFAHIKTFSGLLLPVLLLNACGNAGSDPMAEQTQPAPAANGITPESWPLQAPVIKRDPAMEARIAELLSRMTIEEKVGQIIQADINTVTPEQVRKYNLGSVLNGGGSAPDANLRNSPQSWLDLADEFWEASTDKSDGGVGIPVIWGSDAVHGHAKIVGATVFPHNIGLGAANDPDLLYSIGRITALEMRVTGLDWTFAPTIAVTRNDRWGRTYESYSEDPAIVAKYAPRIVEGIQGKLGTKEFLDKNHILATAKHFVGDGGTTDGKDQGDTSISEVELRDIHSAGYPPAIAAGVQTVMASYNSFNGRKMHGYKEMLNDVLVTRMGLDGFVVGDWNGHGQVEGCKPEACAASLNAGLDMFMAPDTWEALYKNTLKQVKSGEITAQRLDEAVARVLRVKMRAGVFEAGKPSSRHHAGNFALLAAPTHKAVARDAVRKSLVLLKNQAGLLPLSAKSKILVAGNGADDIGKQSGGWTLSWQGTGNSNADFPNGTSIYGGIAAAVKAGGGRAVLSVDGSWKEKPDVAIVVFGEDPYAEFQGDRATVDYVPEDGLKLLQKFKKDGIPAVGVFISGRPLWVNPELNASTAFVAAWLPGTEGGGVADVLIAGPDGKARYDFKGRLSFSWPANATQAAVNLGDKDYEPLFAYGYGLSYASGGDVAKLSEESGLSAELNAVVGRFVAFGDPLGPWKLNLQDSGGNAVITDSRGSSPAGFASMVPKDHEAQEDTFIVNWTGPASLVIAGQPVDFQRETNGDLVMELRYQVLSVGKKSASISMGRGTDWRGTLDLSKEFSEKVGSGWQTSHIRLNCFVTAGARMESITEPLVVTADAGFSLQIASVQLVSNPGKAGCGLSQ